MNDENDEALDVFSYHEALDRTHMMLTNLECALGDHPVILKEEKAHALYEAAVEKLAALYQVLGAMNHSR